MSKLIVIRGLPGSGKTTLAVKEFPGYEHHEADMFFTTLTGEYEYRRELIGHAHNWCQALVAKALVNGRDVVVANTFTRLFELYPYRRMTQAYKAEVKVITAKGCHPSLHNVPEDVIKKMAERWEEIPEGWWEEIVD